MFQISVGFNCIEPIVSDANSSRLFDTPLGSHSFLILVYMVWDFPEFLSAFLDQKQKLDLAYQ